MELPRNAIREPRERANLHAGVSVPAPEGFAMNAYVTVQRGQTCALLGLSGFAIGNLPAGLTLLMRV